MKPMQLLVMLFRRKNVTLSSDLGHLLCTVVNQNTQMCLFWEDGARLALPLVINVGALCRFSVPTVN